MKTKVLYYAAVATTATAGILHLILAPNTLRFNLNIFLITRMPDNPITGRAGPIMPIAIAIEVFQAAFIGLTAAIIVYEIKRKGLSSKTASETA